MSLEHRAEIADKAEAEVVIEALLADSVPVEFGKEH
jgi:hypothetical protein